LVFEEWANGITDRFLHSEALQALHQAFSIFIGPLPFRPEYCFDSRLFLNRSSLFLETETPPASLTFPVRGEFKVIVAHSYLHNPEEVVLPASSRCSKLKTS
jgi:hypothetical protein